MKIGSMTVSSNTDTADSMKANFESEFGDKAPTVEIVGKTAEKTAEPAEDGAEAVQETPERGADGKFKAKPIPDKKAAPEGEEAAVDATEEKPEKALHQRAKEDPKVRVQEVTGKLAAANAAKRQLEQEREALQRRLEEAERRATAPAPQPQAQPQRRQAADEDGDAEPSQDDPKYLTKEGLLNSDYIKDMTAYNARKAVRELNARQMQTAVESHYRQAFETRKSEMAEKLKDIETRYPGFGEALAESELSQIMPLSLVPPGVKQTRAEAKDSFIVDRMQKSAAAGDLIHHLFVAHPEEFHRLQSMNDPADIAVEIAKLENRLSGVTAGTTAKPKSQAPPPVRPVTGGPSAAAPEDDSEPDPDKLSPSEWIRVMNAREARQRAKGSR